SGAWIWRDRSGGVGRNCEVLVLSVLGDVRDLLFPRLERKRGLIITGCLRVLRVKFTRWLLGRSLRPNPHFEVTWRIRKSRETCADPPLQWIHLLGWTEVRVKLFVQFELNTTICFVNLIHSKLVGRHAA